jgi:hypothetical protein
LEHALSEKKLDKEEFLELLKSYYMSDLPVRKCVSCILARIEDFVLPFPLVYKASRLIFVFWAVVMYLCVIIDC